MTPHLLPEQKYEHNPESTLIVTEYNESGEVTNHKEKLYYRYNPDKYQTKLHSDFNLTDLNFFENNGIKFIQFNEMGLLAYLGGDIVSNGCYFLDIIQQLSPYNFKLHMLLKPEANPSTDFVDSSYIPKFSGRACIDQGKLVELNNKNPEGLLARVPINSSRC